MGDTMTCKINADTSNGLELESDTSGVVDIQDNGTTRVTVGDNVDIHGNELILDADGDTSITADTDDQIDFKVGGSDKMTLTSAGNLQLGSANDFSGLQDTLQLGDSQEFKLYHNGGGGEKKNKIAEEKTPTTDIPQQDIQEPTQEEEQLNNQDNG